jgi:hypothetical protein
MQVMVSKTVMGTKNEINDVEILNFKIKIGFSS